MKRLLVCLLLLLTLPASVFAAAAPDSFANPALEARARNLQRHVWKDRGHVVRRGDGGRSANQ